MQSPHANLFAGASAHDFIDDNGVTLADRGYQRLAGGRQNLCFADRTSVIRVAWQRDPADAKREFEILRRVIASGVPTSALLCAEVWWLTDRRTSRQYQAFALERLAGKEPATPDDIAAVGAALSVLHRAVVAPPDDRSATFSLARMRARRSEVSDASTTAAATALLDALDARLAGTPPILCHGDPSPENMLMLGPACRILDWEGAGLGHPETDLGCAAFGLTGRFTLPIKDIVDRLRQGYGRNAPDAEALLLAATAAAFHIAQWRRAYAAAGSMPAEWCTEPLRRATAWYDSLPQHVRRCLSAG